MRGLSGSMRDLDELIEKMSSTNAMRRDVANAVADVSIAKIQQGFRRSTDPNGVRWTNLANPRPRGHRRNGRPLLDTYALANSLTRLGGALDVSRDGFTLTTHLPYARRQQRGDEGPGGIAPRPFLPDEGLPDGWETDAQRAAERAIRKHFR